ncbi:apolipoprotein C-IV isoform X2 [Festucalex cinctus]
MRFLVIALILLIQACGPLWAQTPEPGLPVSPGFLERLLDKARAAKENAAAGRDMAIDFASEYYDEHIQPVVEDYSQWAAGFRDSAKEKIRHYLSFFTANSTDQVATAGAI